MRRDSGNISISKIHIKKKIEKRQEKKFSTEENKHIDEANII
jgi:hypothetical protein